MAACSKYVPRFKKALEYRGLTFPENIINTIGKRAKSDRELDSILHQVNNILEPPGCTKSHCPHFTSYGFCNCSLGRVAGKCDMHLQYRRRLKEREEKQFQSRLTQVPEKFLPLSPENEKRIREADKYTWAKFLKSFKRELK